MKDNVVQVNLWDKNVGLLSWDDKRSCSVFQFDKNFMQYGWNIAPLVAPVYESEKHEWEVYLPEDKWVHLWTGKEYQGGTVTVAAELGYTPAFYRKDSKYAELFSEIREKYGVK